MADETEKTGLDAASNGTADTPARAPEAAPLQSGAASPVPEKPSAGDMKTDIAKILSEVKLPERRPAPETPKGAEIKPIDALLSASPAPAAPTAEAQPAPAAPPTPEPAVTPQERRPSIVSVHTLKDDLQGVVRDQKISVVRAAALEEDKRRGAEELLPAPEPSRLRGVLLAALLLFVLGILALGGVYFAMEQQHAPVAVPTNNSLVFAESSNSIPITGTTPATLKQSLANIRQLNGTLGSIARIVPVVTTTNPDGTSTPRPATFSEFMSALGARIPDELLRALSDDYFVGMHTVDKNAPVIIVPVTSYERAFAGMLAWEPTMNADLAPFFTPVPQFMTVDGIPTQRTFTDSVFRNYDVRTLADDQGTIQLYYSFPTRNILIIAESPYTFTEILTRLQAQRSL